MSRSPADRRRFILARASSVGHIGISELAGQLNVSMETVRRDVAIMEVHGLMRRTRGGAYAVQRPNSFNSSAETDESAAAADLIAATGVEQINGAHTVYIDEGYLIQVFASTLAVHRLSDSSPSEPLTVVTPSLAVATILAPVPGVDVVILGGRVRPGTLATLDRLSVELSGFAIDLAVVDAAGVSVAAGVTTDDSTVAGVKSQLISISQRRGLLAHRARFGHSARFRFADIGDFDFIVTDSSLLPHEAKQYAALGPRVIRV